MLVLSRKLNEEIRIGENILVRVLGIKGNQVRLGIVAAPEVLVLREEIMKTTTAVPRQHCGEERLSKCARC